MVITRNNPSTAVSTDLHVFFYKNKPYKEHKALRIRTYFSYLTLI